jgi:hypothetical protein
VARRAPRSDPADRTDALNQPFVRRVLALLLLIGLAPGTWLHGTLPPPSDAVTLHFQSLPLPPASGLEPHLGAFTLEAAWRLESPNAHFGGYSALLPVGGGQLLAVSDRGYLLRFSPPGAPQRPLRIVPILAREGPERKQTFDAESATFDAAGGRVWIGWEFSNRITRHGLDFGAWQTVRPPAMRGWGDNSGPEALARLADGRFAVLREGFDGRFDGGRHRGLIFRGDPIAARHPRSFTFAGPPRFRPTDMAQLPDGRVLILMRRLVWPLPARFAGRIVIADPADIRPDATWRGTVVAKLSSSLPVDNFEGLAIEPRADGKVTVWLISDANGAVTQRTLLWKLAVDPAALPGTSKKARG